MKSITKFTNALMEKYLPDPYIFVVILTLLVVTVLHDVRHRQTRAHTAEIAAFLRQQLAA